MKKKLLGAAAAIFVALGGIAEAGSLKMSHVRPQGSTIDTELREFADAVNSATGGAVEINIFAASALGDYTSVQELISVGSVEMATQPAAAGAEAVALLLFGFKQHKSPRTVPQRARTALRRWFFGESEADRRARVEQFRQKHGAVTEVLGKSSGDESK